MFNLFLQILRYRTSLTYKLVWGSQVSLSPCLILTADIKWDIQMNDIKTWRSFSKGYPLTWEKYPFSQIHSLMFCASNKAYLFSRTLLSYWITERSCFYYFLLLIRVQHIRPQDKAQWAVNLSLFVKYQWGTCSFLKFHIIVEQLRLEQTSGGHPLQPPAQGGEHLQQASQDHIQTTVKYL